LVSIAIPVYKSTFLKQAIDSVLAQTFADWELIIVNDASPEPISVIVKEYTEPRISYYENVTNIGMENPAANWNRCLELARGNFFCLLCDDDCYEPSFLDEMLAIADKYPTVSVFRSRAKIINETGDVLDYYPSAPEWESCSDYIWHKESRVRRQSISEFFLRRKYICDLGGYFSLPKAWFADEISIYRFAQENGIASVNRPLFRFRESWQSISCNNHFNVRHKVEACNIYYRWLGNFIASWDEEYVRIVTKKSINRKNFSMTTYLTNASWRDYIFLWMYRKSNRYHIYSQCFIKALCKRIAKMISSQ